jgi:hypothetical protein
MRHPRCRDTQPYRDLIAGILQQAVIDATQGRMEFAAPAYLWLRNVTAELRMYCNLLDINPEKFSAAFVALHRERGERFASAWSRLSEEKRAQMEESTRAREEAEERKKLAYEAVKHNKSRKAGEAPKETNNVLAARKRAEAKRSTTTSTTT